MDPRGDGLIQALEASFLALPARMRPMTEKSEKASASEALKRALAAKRAKSSNGAGFGGAVGGRTTETSMQRQAAALNKPAFRRASKRG